MDTKVIVITNNKGGVGKTTVTYGLALALAKRNKRVLLLDSDPQGSLSRRSGYEPKEYTSQSLYDCLENELRTKGGQITDFILPTDNAYIDILTGDIRLNINRNEVAMVFMRANFIYKKKYQGLTASLPVLMTAVILTRSLNYWVFCLMTYPYAVLLRRISCRKSKKRTKSTFLIR